MVYRTTCCVVINTVGALALLKIDAVKRAFGDSRGPSIQCWSETCKLLAVQAPFIPDGILAVPCEAPGLHLLQHNAMSVPCSLPTKVCRIQHEVLQMAQWDGQVPCIRPTSKEGGDKSMHVRCHVLARTPVGVIMRPFHRHLDPICSSTLSTWFFRFPPRSCSSSSSAVESSSSTRRAWSCNSTASCSAASLRSDATEPTAWGTALLPSLGSSCMLFWSVVVGGWGLACCFLRAVTSDCSVSIDAISLLSTLVYPAPRGGSWRSVRVAHSFTGIVQLNENPQKKPSS